MTATPAARLLASIAAISAAMLLLIGFTAVTGAAASLNSGTATLGAARVSPARCVSSGLSVLPVLVGTTWTGVTVSGIPAACGGGTLQLTVNTGATNSSGSAAVPVGGGSLTITLATAQTVDANMQSDLVFVGP